MDLYFSIIIPTYKRVEILDKNLSFLEHGQQNQFALVNNQGSEFTLTNYEVIVSDDNYPEARDKLCLKYPWVKWLRGPKKGPAANRNQGAKKALGEWLIFIDDDCEPTSSLLHGYFLTTKEKNSKVIENIRK